MIRVIIKNNRENFRHWEIGDVGWVLSGKSLADWHKRGDWVSVKHSEHDGMACFHKDDIYEEPLEVK